MRNPNRGNPLNISINNNSNKIVYKATDTLTNLHLTIHKRNKRIITTIGFSLQCNMGKLYRHTIQKPNKIIRPKLQLTYHDLVEI